MAPNNDNEPVEVFAGNTWEAELVKSMLADTGIESYVWDENTGTLAPWYTAPGGAGSVRVVVSTADLEAARAVVTDFETNRGSESPE